MAFNYSPKVVTDGLVLYLDAANQYSYVSGSTSWNDISRGGINGTLVGGPTYDSANGGSIVFDRVDDFDLVSSNGFGIFNNQSFTIDMMINPNTLSGDHPFFSYDFTSHAVPFYATHIRQLGNGQIFFGWNDGTNYQFINTSSNILNSLGLWYGITIVYTSGRQEIWVNGVLRASSTRTDVITYYNQPVWIGKANFAAKYGGKIGNCRYYNRALSAQEILQNYNATKTRFGLT
jgi:hypothetical protein